MAAGPKIGTFVSPAIGPVGYSTGSRLYHNGQAFRGHVYDSTIWPQFD